MNTASLETTLKELRLSGLCQTLAARQKTVSFPETEGETKTDKCDRGYR
jgi:hypothetical protein